jgi:hypothetical protein
MTGVKVMHTAFQRVFWLKVLEVLAFCTPVSDRCKWQASSPDAEQKWLLWLLMYRCCWRSLIGTSAAPGHTDAPPRTHSYVTC